MRRVLLPFFERKRPTPRQWLHCSLTMISDARHSMCQSYTLLLGTGGTDMFHLRVGDHEIEVEIVARQPQLLVRVDGVVHEIAADRSVGNELDFEIDGLRYQGWRCRDGDDVHVRIDGTTSRVRIEADTLQSGGATAQQVVRADMPGIVIALHCEPGQALHAGDK